MSGNTNSTNNSNDNDNNNNNNNNVYELNVAAAALAISIVALLAATLQIAQAIFASARGLPNCDERVMGKWSLGTKRRPKWSQLRLEVSFEAPIIYRAPPGNKRHPDPGEAWHAEGTEESCRKTRVDFATLSPQDGEKEPVHTVNNELATWVYLLISIERMEKDSKAWEEKTREDDMGYTPPGNQPGLPDPTLTVKIQAKPRSFDTNPAIKKPYATTTISHLVELASVLGIYWKVFDRDDNKYRAEGNGYSLTGSRIADFGVVFVFEKTGPTVFEERRVIPASEVKELCFGRVPTVFRQKLNQHEDVEWQNPLKTSSGTGKKVEILQMGSKYEIADTLTHIGCNVKTTLYYKEGKKHRHLFPVTFEIIGMVGRVIHIKNRCFRYLPNPTIFPWDRDSLSLIRLLGAFSEQIFEDFTHIAEVAKKMTENEKIESGVKSEIESEIGEIGTLVDKADKLHEALEDSDLTYRRLNSLHETIEWTDDILTNRDQNVVLDVLRRHLQEVLGAINNEGPTDSEDEASISFDDLQRIPLEMREKRFMQTYFKGIRWRVASIDADRRKRQDPEQVSQAVQDQEQVSRAIHKDMKSNRQRTRVENGHFQGADALTPPSPRINIPDPLDSPEDPPKLKLQRTGALLAPGLANRGTWPDQLDEAEDKEEDQHIGFQRVAIWYTLVFRMICWLTLHDFDKRDKQVPKSELIGNRQPVFIM